MSRPFLSAILIVLLLTIVGCAKPSTVSVFKTPIPDVYLTFETYTGYGPVSSDDMRLYAHFTQDGYSTELLILEGEELEIGKLVWLRRDALKICLSAGTTDLFRNQVILTLGRRDRKLHSYLSENC